MGDQFPSDVHYFIEFAQRSSDLNALLQGLVGRACGYNKDSLVILSDYNQQILDRFVATHGDYVTKPSRHSVVAGSRSGLSMRQQLTIDRDPSDQILEAFFRDTDCQIVQPTVPPGTNMKPKRTGKGGRRGPVLTLVEQHQLFDHIENPTFQGSNLPHVYDAPEIVRRGETIQLTESSGSTIQGKYLTDASGACRYNFRKAGYAGRAGIKGRGRGKRDAADLTLNHGILEPSIGLRKRDPVSGEWLDDPTASGEWVAVSITLPLRKPCLMGSTPLSGRISLPGKLCVYDKHMTKRERAQRDGQA
jgi:hypothetical protein